MDLERRKRINHRGTQSSQRRLGDFEAAFEEGQQSVGDERQ
jgi:hypothetical protein